MSGIDAYQEDDPRENRIKEIEGRLANRHIHEEDLWTLLDIIKERDAEIERLRKPVGKEEWL